MNQWTKLSVDYANQRNYLDSLFKVYPISPNLRRKIKQEHWEKIEKNFYLKDNFNIIKELLSLEVFPIKDSYVSFLRRDKNAIYRNPETINRLAGSLYEMGLDEIYEKCTEPKETNRQIGPLFKRWIDKGFLGVKIFQDSSDFLSYEGNCIFNSSDSEMQKFACKYLGYTRNKGLDFIAKFNGKFVIGEAKFLTDFGGHQDAQFEDAISTINSPIINKTIQGEVIKIAICDGVLYINSNSKMHKYLKTNDNKIILSSLLLREFLYSL